MIKVKKARRLAQLDASDLTLYKATLSAAEVGSRLKEGNTNSKGRRIPLPVEMSSRVRQRTWTTLPPCHYHPQNVRKCSDPSFC
jgi:hypothetical protein